MTATSFPSISPTLPWTSACGKEGELKAILRSDRPYRTSASLLIKIEKIIYRFVLEVGIHVSSVLHLALKLAFTNLSPGFVNASATEASSPEQERVVGLYARVSTNDKGQNPEVQLAENRQHCESRGWPFLEYIDTASGAKESRPALDRMLNDIRRGKIKIVVVSRLDRLGRSLKHLVNLLAEFHERNVALISLKEGLDFSTSTGRLLFHVIAALAEFERDLIRERVKAGLAYAKARGKRLGRPALIVNHAEIADLKRQGLSIRTIAKKVGASPAYICKLLTGTARETE